MNSAWIYTDYIGPELSLAVLVGCCHTSLRGMFKTSLLTQYLRPDVITPYLRPDVITPENGTTSISFSIIRTHKVNNLTQHSFVPLFLFFEVHGCLSFHVRKMRSLNIGLRLRMWILAASFLVETTLIDDDLYLTTWITLSNSVHNPAGWDSSHYDTIPSVLPFLQFTP